MRRFVLYGVGWLVAAAVAVVLAWQGVGRVGTSITNRHPRALTAEEARQALAEPVGGGPDGGVPVTSPPASQPGGGASAGERGTTTTRPARSTTPTTARPPATTGPTSPPATSPPSPSPTSPAATQPPSSTSPPTTSGVVKTYNLTGGSATLRFDPSGKVTVVWANPNPGYRVEVDDRSDGGVRIRFDGERHRSELEAWWDGQPRERIEESGDDASGSGRG